MRDKYLKNAKKRMKSVARLAVNIADKSNVTFIGVHVRRTDYVEYR